MTAADELECWGLDEEGQTGTDGGDRVSRPTPVDLDGTIRTVTTGRRHTCALTEAGATYCWGVEVDEPRRVARSDRIRGLETGGEANRLTCLVDGESRRLGCLSFHPYGDTSVSQLVEGGDESVPEMAEPSRVEVE